MPPLVVTRPQPDAALWVQQLHNQGVPACALPLMEIGASRSAAAQTAVAQAMAQLPHYQALMFVSGNAVRYFFAQLEKTRQSLPAHAQCWSPGPGTTQALLDEGVVLSRIVQPAVNAVQFDSESLWQQAQPHVHAGQRVLIVRGGDGMQAQGQGRPWLTEQLTQCGVHVDFAPVYERHAPQVTEQLLTQIDALRTQQATWLFSSSECVQHLVLCNPDWSWQAHTALATHPRIAQHAQRAGFGQVIGTQPSLAAITASIKSLHEHP